MCFSRCSLPFLMISFPTRENLVKVIIVQKTIPAKCLILVFNSLNFVFFGKSICFYKFRHNFLCNMHNNFSALKR